MVDQVQRVMAEATPGVLPAPELIGARTWSTAVPRDLFTRVTGSAPSRRSSPMSSTAPPSPIAATPS
jgi:hypothetical protein